MLKKNQMPPSHPGEILSELFIKPRNLTVTEVSEGLGISRPNLSMIINGRGGISPELAVKLAAAFDNSPEFWVNLQKNYELWHAKQKVDIRKIKHFVAA